MGEGDMGETVMNREIIFDASRWICLFIAWACAADLIATLGKFNILNLKGRFDYILAAEFMAWLWTREVISYFYDLNRPLPQHKISKNGKSPFFGQCFRSLD